MASITQLGYLGLGVRSVDEWERFATQTLGLQVSERDDEGSLFLRIDEYHHRFIIRPDGKDDVAFIGWEVKDEQALLAMVDQLKGAGVEARWGTQAEAEARRVAGLVAFKDPNGIASELFYGPLVNFERPFKSPRALTGFMTGEMGLGHIVIAVDDFKQSLQFYRDVLGMKISDFIQLQTEPTTKTDIVFLHCNPRHHSLAFSSMPRPPKRLHHFMLQLKSLDDVGATYYLCQDQSVPIIGTLGRHTNDHMVSFYLCTPAGFAVEYGWGAREVDDSVWQVQMHTEGSIWGHRGIMASLEKPT